MFFVIQEGIQDGGHHHLEFLSLLHFWHNMFFNWSRNISSKFGDDWSNIDEMATVFPKPRWRQPSSWMLVRMHWRRSCVLNRNCKIFTKFSNNSSDNEEVAAGFRNWRWRRPPAWKVHFRLNRHYKKCSSKLPFKKLIFVGAPWQSIVVYSWWL